MDIISAVQSVLLVVAAILLIATAAKLDRTKETPRKEKAQV